MHPNVSQVGSVCSPEMGAVVSIRPGHHWTFAPWAEGSVRPLGWVLSSPFGASLPLLSLAYIIQAMLSCLRLFTHWMPCAFCFALDKAGKSIAAKIAIMAMTTSNSIKVNPDRHPGPKFLFRGMIEVFIGLFELL